MSFNKFKKVKVQHPETGDELERFRVVDSIGVEYPLAVGDMEWDDLKERKDELIGKVTLRRGSYGLYAVISGQEVLDES